MNTRKHDRPLPVRRKPASDIEAIMRKCKLVLQEQYGPRFRGLVLYGSWARHQAEPESDIDLLVLFDRPFDYSRELRRIVDLLYPIQLESERLISAKPAVAAEFEQGRLYLYRQARRDGWLVT